MSRLSFHILFIAIILASCQSNRTEQINPNLSLTPGSWRLNMISNESFIPLRFELDSALALTIVNSDERIIVQDIQINNDSIRIRLPRFDSEFIGKIHSTTQITGNWHNYLRTDYSIPFEAFYVGRTAPSDRPATSTTKYEVWFSPGSEDEYKALGLFHIFGEELHGTFLTETGDYRYLQGTNSTANFNLSCFDGSHLFAFNGEYKGDSIINGTFRSGKHWTEPWIGVKNESYELAHPDSLTYLLPGFETITADLIDLQGEITTLDQSDYLGHVTILQIFGSWCPNCYDENVFYNELYKDYNKRGLNIIPIAFERTDDFNQNVEAVQKQFKEIGITYPAFIGGKANKTIASKKFPMLNKIISFPTSIYLDKHGIVRKIHTGFYGPGTGIYYDNYTRETRAFLEELLSE
ncbi:MAG: thiol-disulfide isomerase/thioredoxin [Flavobacteriales bacterium]|jgi:thiol-disulfide isomerase/thioredoxin